MFQKIKDFFIKKASTNDSRSLRELMSSVGYNKDILQEFGEEDFDVNLAKKFTALRLDNKRILIEQDNKESWPAFQIANAQEVHNICFINFFPKNLKGLLLKMHKSKKVVFNLKTFEEAQELSECIFVSYGNFNLHNSVKVGSIESEKDFVFLFNGNLSEISKIEKALVSKNIIGFSASTSIFDGSILGFKKIFTPMKTHLKTKQSFSEEEIRMAISMGKFNFNHIQNLFESLDSNKILSVVKRIPNIGNNIDQLNNTSKSMKAIIRSMTPKEKQNPMILNANSRIDRIAKGSGQSEQVTRRFINQMLNLMQMLKNPEVRKKFLENSDVGSLMNLFQGLKK